MDNINQRNNSIDDKWNHSFDDTSRPTATGFINNKSKLTTKTILQSQDTMNTVMNGSNKNTLYKNQPNSPGKQSYPQVQNYANQGGASGILKKQGLSFKSTLSYRQQISNQSSIRSQENKFRHVQILKNILRQAKKQRKEKKKAKKLDKRKNTLLKRGAKMHSSLYQKNSSFIEQEEETESDEDEEIDQLERRQQEETSSKYLFMPDSIFKQIWDFIVLILIIEQSIFIPFQMCFNTDENQTLRIIQLIVDLIFMSDILVSFNSGLVYKGILVLNRKQAIFIYLKTWFITDLLSSLPYDYIFDDIMQQEGISGENFAKYNQNNDFQGGSSIFRLLKIIRFMRILKLLRVFKLSRIIIVIEESIVSDELMFVLRFAKIMIRIIFFAHWIACFYWAVGFQQLDSHEDTWITHAGLRDESLNKQYVWSLYWAIQTMCTVGYGDLPPRNTNEQIYVILSLFFASVIYAQTLNSVFNMVKKYNLLAAQYREKMMYVNQFLIKKNLPNDLRLKVWRYLQYIWEIKKQIKIEEEEVFKVLNQDLKERITVCMNGFILQTIPFFEDFINSNPEFTSELTFHTRKQTFAIDDNIFIKDDYFGEIAFFTDNPRCITMKSRDFTDVYIIERDVFLDLAQDCEDVIKLYHEINHSIDVLNDYSIIKLECFICRKVGHRALDCQSFHHKKGNLIQIYNRVMKRSSSSLSASMMRLQDKINGVDRKTNGSPKLRNSRASVSSPINRGENSESINGTSGGGFHISPQFVGANDSNSESRNKNISMTKSYEMSSLKEDESFQGTNKFSTLTVTNTMQYLTVDENGFKKSRQQKINEVETDFSTDAIYQISKKQKSNNDVSYGVKQLIQVGGNSRTTALESTLSDFNTSSNKSQLFMPQDSQDKKTRKKRNSVLYETLLIKLREESKNPENEIIQEVSEDSFQSESVSEEGSKHTEDKKIEEEKEGLPFNITLQKPSNSIFKNFYNQNNLFAQNLAIVPEENESLYSNVFNLKDSHDDSSSRMGGVTDTLLNSQTKIGKNYRFPSFNSNSKQKYRRNSNNRKHSEQSLEQNLTVQYQKDKTNGMNNASQLNINHSDLFNNDGSKTLQHSQTALDHEFSLRQLNLK